MNHLGTRFSLLLHQLVQVSVKELVLDVLVNPDALIPVSCLQGSLEGCSQVLLHPGFTCLLDSQISLGKQLQSVPLKMNKYVKLETIIIFQYHDVS